MPPVARHAFLQRLQPFLVSVAADARLRIGGYTDEEWIKALQKGVARDGRHLYPAMPYASYTKMSREDALAIKAYLFSLKPVETAPTPAATMKFPYDQRWGLAFWNMVNAPNHRLEPDTSKSAAWNRGAYLVEALGHCGECHTPRAFTGGARDLAWSDSGPKTEQISFVASSPARDPSVG